MPFAEKAKALYCKGNLSQKEIAKLVGVSESMVSRYLSGETVPKEDVAERILDVLAKAIPKEAPTPEQTTPTPKKEDPDMRIALDSLTRAYENHIGELRGALKNERREKWVFVGMLVVVIALVFLIFFIDLTNGNVGWWRY